MLHAGMCCVSLTESFWEAVVLFENLCAFVVVFFLTPGQAIELKPTEIVYYSNRSAAYAAIGSLKVRQFATAAV
jgi:hypothetical protein